MTVTVTLADRQTDGHNEANNGLRNFFLNVQNKMCLKARDKDCGEGQLIESNVEQYN